MAPTCHKIAVSGTHGAGKSTLISAYLERAGFDSRRTAVLEEVPRKIAERCGDLTMLRPSSNTFSRQALLVAEQIAREAMHPGNGVLLCDRTVLDHLAYTLLLFQDMKASVEMAMLKETAREWMGTYDAVVYLPQPSWGVRTDGMRDDDLAFQREIDCLIRELYDEMGIRLFHSTDENLSSRVEFLARVVDGC